MTFPAPRSILTVVAIVAVAALAGCAAPVSIKSYDGPQLPAEDTAVLLVDRQIFVSDIGAYKTGIKLTTKEESMEGTLFEVKPGPQKIVFSYYSFTSSSDNVGVPPPGTRVTTTYKSAHIPGIALTYDFKKGHKYEVHYRVEGKNFQTRIIDVTTGGARRGYAIAWGQVYGTAGDGKSSF